jgi:hypothetical protein
MQARCASPLAVSQSMRCQVHVTGPRKRPRIAQIEEVRLAGVGAIDCAVRSSPAVECVNTRVRLVQVARKRLGKDSSISWPSGTTSSPSAAAACGRTTAPPNWPASSCPRPTESNPSTTPPDTARCGRINAGHTSLYINDSRMDSFRRSPSLKTPEGKNRAYMTYRPLSDREPGRDVARVAGRARVARWDSRTTRRTRGRAIVGGRADAEDEGAALSLGRGVVRRPAWSSSRPFRQCLVRSTREWEVSFGAYALLDPCLGDGGQQRRLGCKMRCR